MMAEGFEPMTPSEMEKAFTAFLDGAEMSKLYAGRLKGSTGLAGGPR